MTIIETHPFEPYNSEDATTLIIGSFPCFNGENYGEWFYSGSGRSDFWKLLSETFNMPVDNLEQKQELCSQNKIAITDVAYKIERTKNNCSDSNLKIVEYNKDGILKCLTPNIKKIFCTSKFVEKHFKSILPDLNIPTYTLLPPSPAANRYVASLSDYKSKKLKNEISSVYNFKLLNYRLLFEN
jgi:hypoxanthine-DNA glycosylase